MAVTPDHSFANTEVGVAGFQIGETGDYLIRRVDQWYYWLGSTSPRENFGPFADPEDALAAYNGDGDHYAMTDIDFPDGDPYGDVDEEI
jgi:hypothetical protein